MHRTDRETKRFFIGVTLIPFFLFSSRKHLVQCTARMHWGSQRNFALGRCYFGMWIVHGRKLKKKKRNLFAEPMKSINSLYVCQKPQISIRFLAHLRVFFFCSSAAMLVECKLSGDFATTRIIDAKMNTKLLMPFHNWYTNANLYGPISRCSVCVCICVAYGNRRQTYSPVGKRSAAPSRFFHLHFCFCWKKTGWKFICAANCASKKTPLPV